MFNDIRKNHGVEPMQWSPDLETKTAAITKSCSQSVGSDNLAYLASKGHASWKDAIEFWYLCGLSTYNFTDPMLHRSDLFLNIVVT
ncbi:uncharacterized protein VTP21DRAFT_10696 [Calcarisporiella thermophila]|uniref:uncharacterized protein n=1 Tax=Calcarisporiella thermophila TaxID=911321 RepID=UPI003743FEB9